MKWMVAMKITSAPDTDLVIRQTATPIEHPRLRADRRMFFLYNVSHNDLVV